MTKLLPIIFAAACFASCARHDDSLLDVYIPDTPMCAPQVKAAEEIEGVKIRIYRNFRDSFEECRKDRSVFVVSVFDAMQLWKDGGKFKILWAASAGYSEIISAKDKSAMEEINFSYSRDNEAIAKFFSKNAAGIKLNRHNDATDEDHLAKKYRMEESETALFSVPRLSRIKNSSRESYVLAQSRDLLLPYGLKFFPEALVIAPDETEPGVAAIKLFEEKNSKLADYCAANPDIASLSLKKAGISGTPEILASAIADSHMVFLKPQEFSEELEKCAQLYGIKNTEDFINQTKLK